MGGGEGKERSDAGREKEIGSQGMVASIKATGVGKERGGVGWQEVGGWRWRA